MINICHCGSAAGYPHASDCPRPLFRGSDSEVQRWLDERASLRTQLKIHACTHCGALVDNFDYTLCAECFETGQRAGSAST